MISTCNQPFKGYLTIFSDANLLHASFKPVCHYFSSSEKVQRIAMNVSICVSARDHTSKTTCPKFTKFSASVACGSFLFWRLCDALCTSDFVDNIIRRREKGVCSKRHSRSHTRGGGWVKFNVYGCIVAAVFINQPYYNSIRERHRMLIVVASAASAAAGTVDVVDSNDATAIDAASRRLATFHYRSTESRTAAQLRHIRSVMLAHGPT